MVASSYAEYYGGSSGTTSSLVVEGVIAVPIVINDSYLSANGRQFIFDFLPPAGIDINDASCLFGGKRPNRGEWLVTGSLSEVVVSSIDKWRATFELATTDTSPLLPGCFSYSVEIRGPDGEHITGEYGKVDVIDSQTK